MKLYTVPKEDDLLREKLAGRKKLYDRNLIKSIGELFDQVQNRGNQAIIELTRQFDHQVLNSLELTDDFISQAVQGIPESLRDAIENSLSNILEVNSFLLPDPLVMTEIRPGTQIGEKTTPLDSVGLWVPARKGPLISTALMLIGAAKAAGVPNIYVGMPPSTEGQADKATVAACSIAGADKIYLGNGVGIIAGFSIGTESIPEVQGIYGPGPGGIAASMAVAFSYGKKTVLGIGPTDAAILCDEKADPNILAYDLINEAEHGPDSSAILVTTSLDVAKKTILALDELIASFPDKKRKENLQHVFSKGGYGAIIHVQSMDKAIALIEDYAPEHMIVKCEKTSEEYILKNIKNAGEILLGNYTPFSAGNYAIGITAVLPTNGFARNISGITSKDMIKTSTVGKLDKDALKKLQPTISEIGKWEGLPAHQMAADIRFSKA
jgi:histidinol dehydrogenase